MIKPYAQLGAVSELNGATLNFKGPEGMKRGQYPYI